MVIYLQDRRYMILAGAGLLVVLAFFGLPFINVLQLKAVQLAYVPGRIDFALDVVLLWAIPLAGIVALVIPWVKGIDLWWSLAVLSFAGILALVLYAGRAQNSGLQVGYESGFYASGAAMIALAALASWAVWQRMNKTPPG